MNPSIRPVLSCTALLLSCPAALAQTISIAAPTISGVPAPVNWGGAVAILGDLDGLGRRDLLVAAPGNGGSTASGQCYVMSTETSAPLGNIPLLNAVQLGYPFGTNGLKIGHAVANVGNIDSDPADDFAIAVPNVNVNEGRVHLFSMRPAVGGGLQYVPLGWLVGQQSFGSSLAMVNDPAGPRLAVGVPAWNRVELFDLPALMATGVILPGAAPVRVLSDPTFIPNPGTNTASFGFSIAAGPAATPTGTPSFFMAVGVPDYGPTTNPFSGEGYVAIFDLATGSNAPVARLGRSVVSERLGRAVATVGFLPNPPLPAPSSPRPDFAVLGGNGNLVMFHTPSATGVTATVATIAAQNAPGVDDGRLVNAGDLDCDGLGDLAVCSGGLLRFYTTGGLSLTQLAQTGAAASYCGLTSGPDVFQTGATDVVAGPQFAGPTPPRTVRVLPVATASVLANTTTLRLSAGTRPILSGPAGNNFLAVTATSQAISGPVFLFGDIAPIAPTPAQPPFGGGLLFLGPNLVTLGAGVVAPGTPFTWSLQMPNTGLYQSAILQAALIPSTGPWVASDGVLARYGAF